MFAQRSLSICSYSHETRKYTSNFFSETNHPLSVPPSNIRCESDLHRLFEPLKEYMATQRRQDKDQGKFALVALSKPASSCSTTTVELFKQVGTRVKIKWCADEIGDSGWRPGWYVATVQGYDSENDVISLTYQSEPGCTYYNELTPLLTENKITLVKPIL